LIGWFFGWLVAQSCGWFDDFLRSVGLLVGWLIGWLVGRCFSWLNGLNFD